MVLNLMFIHTVFKNLCMLEAMSVPGEHKSDDVCPTVPSVAYVSLGKLICQIHESKCLVLKRGECCVEGETNLFHLRGIQLGGEGSGNSRIPL